MGSESPFNLLIAPDVQESSTAPSLLACMGLRPLRSSQVKRAEREALGFSPDSCRLAPTP